MGAINLAQLVSQWRSELCRAPSPSVSCIEEIGEASFHGRARRPAKRTTGIAIVTTLGTLCLEYTYEIVSSSRDPS